MQREQTPPMMTLLARWFGVPLVIVSAIVGSAIVVVLLFGSIAAEGERGIDELLRLVESDGGEKVLGVALLPQDKEVWQAARELSMRLEKKDVELAPDDVGVVVARLSALADRLLNKSEQLGETGLQKLQFVLSALAKTGETEAVGPLVRCLAAPRWQIRREALQALAIMHDNPAVREQAAGRICTILREDPEPVVRTVAAYALSFVADPGDREVIAALEQACQNGNEDREVIWNAALSLARLGSDAARSELLDMLDRTYWESSVKVRRATGNGQVVENPVPPYKVEEYLITAIEAVTDLDDPDLRAAVARLEQDSSLRVVDRVLKAKAARQANVEAAAGR